MTFGPESHSHAGSGGARVFAIATALLVFAAPAAVAQTSDFDRFSLSLGVFVTSRDGHMRMDGSVRGSGTRVDLERDLGLDSSTTTARLDGYLRFNEKHRLDFSVFDLSRSAAKLIPIEIEWDRTIYPIDTFVETNFDLKIYKLAYTWAFMRRDRGYLGLTAGFYVADIGTELFVETLIPVSINSVTAPLPVAGLRGEYDLTPKWTFRTSAEVFAIDYGPFSGTLFDLYAGLDYRLGRHWAVGVAYNYSLINATVEKRKFNGELEWDYSGGLLFVKLDF